MGLFDKPPKRVFNTGGHLPKPNQQQQFEIVHNWDAVVPPIVLQHTRETGNIIYGSRAVNALVGSDFSRPTHDFDIFSPMPKRHAVQVEQRIDRHMGCDIAYVERNHYLDGGKWKPLFRVVTRPVGDPDVDYNKKPRKMGFVVKNGVRYEPLPVAKKKYGRMIQGDDLKRFYQGHIDLNRILDAEAFNRVFKGVNCWGFR